MMIVFCSYNNYFFPKLQKIIEINYNLPIMPTYDGWLKLFGSNGVQLFIFF